MVQWGANREVEGGTRPVVMLRYIHATLLVKVWLGLASLSSTTELET